MKTIDTRDLYKRQQDLQSLKEAVESAREELKEAEDTLTEKQGKLAALEETPEDEASEATLEIASEEVEDAETAVSDAQSALDEAQAAFGTDEQEELEELDNLESEISDWRHGEILIPEDEFEDYARELADDLGSTKGNEWPFTCIDWEKAADELKYDYTSVSYQGTDYYVRA